MEMVKTILEILNTSSVQRCVKPFSNNFFFFVILILSTTENFGLKVLPKSGYKFLQTVFSFFFKLASTGVILIDE